jgi:hypothetical protein
MTAAGVLERGEFYYPTLYNGLLFLEGLQKTKKKTKEEYTQRRSRCLRHGANLNIYAHTSGNTSSQASGCQKAVINFV